MTNMGLVGEEAGAGAKYLFMAPAYDGEIPEGHLARRLKTNHFLICGRAAFPDPQQGLDYLRTLRVYRSRR